MVNSSSIPIVTTTIPVNSTTIPSTSTTIPSTTTTLPSGSYDPIFPSTIPSVPLEPAQPIKLPPVEDSILLSVKKMLGYPSDMEAFDIDIMTNINSSLMILNQLGVGSPEGFFIAGPYETYEMFLGKDVNKQKMVNMYLYLKTKLGFDPPASTAVMESMKEMIKEHEFRLQIVNDPKPYDDEEPDEDDSWEILNNV